MATIILLLMILLLGITAVPWLGNILGHTHAHHTDLMAGDEGED